MEEGWSPDGGFVGPDDAVFIPGIGYAPSWREADVAAQELNAVIEDLGLDRRIVRAIAHVGPNGEPVVWLRIEGVRLLAGLLEEIAGERRRAC
ncbi:hypothetical protein [Streptomyces alanosinicus]|uniref:Uncharacterized protein n=1 Tax=Streptomyces alanosinicus TaxID=68171 RepID=A0A919D657_9ACTN|nr:hypothetical protein [Streptomyces alanosinicus]GHE11505.1 hypothetical protein GCM10010339_71520 [Streptomyces alanosinicus]